MSKDREVKFELVPGEVEILYRTSSDTPKEYAIVLRVYDAGKWRAVVSADNAHDDHVVAVHHMHRYGLNGQKLAAERLPFPVPTGNSTADANAVMFKIIDWMTENWEELTS